MSTEKWKTREPVVEKDVVGPGKFGVAGLALIAQASVMRIIRCVAGIAPRLQRHIENRFGMTVGAFQCLVRPMDFVVRVDVVVELYEFPPGADMAGVARSAQVTVVIVILEVAGNAGHIELVREGIIAVALTTREIRMVPVKREPGVPRMVKACIVPTNRAMAVLALLATFAVVHIVLSVAAIAGYRRIRKRVVFVAVEALCVLVEPDKRVAGDVVIKSDIQPAARRMAVSALRAHRVAVNIVRLVAAVAILRGITEPGIRRVAALATGLGMFAVQRKVGVMMIEGRPVELHNIGIPAFVISVAAETGASAGLPVAAMKTHVGADIISDLIVAVQA